jgi:hypothetical protein
VGVDVRAQEREPVRRRRRRSDECAEPPGAEEDKTRQGHNMYVYCHPLLEVSQRLQQLAQVGYDATAATATVKNIHMNDE